MRIDPHAQAQRLTAGIDSDLLPDLATSPFVAIEVLFESVVVKTRPPLPPGAGCGVDGTYDPGPPPSISIANDVSPARQRFTALHELGHHLIELDEYLNDLDDSVEQRREEICDEVAATILLPDDLVDRMLPMGTFTASDVVRLHAEADSPSRAACCVAAARRLRLPGCVILGRSDGVADFIAHHPATPWRIARGTWQGPDSLLARVAASRSRHLREEMRLRFSSGTSSTVVHGDAFSAPDGWVFMVAVADSHSPWVRSLNFGSSDTGFGSESVECPRCDNYFTPHWAPCKTCGDYRCPDCHHCSCSSAPVEDRRCGVCTQLKPLHQFEGEGDICVDCR